MKEVNDITTNERYTAFQIATNQTEAVSVKKTSLTEMINTQSINPSVVNNLLTLRNDDSKKRLTQSELKDIYKNELVGKKSFRFSSAKIRVSDLDRFDVVQGLGLISIDCRPIAFAYGHSEINEVSFKARLGLSKSLKCRICIVKTATEKYIVPDYLIFRGRMQDKSEFSNTLNLVYTAVENFFDFNISAEDPSTIVGDYLFNVLALGLGGKLNEKGEVK